MSAVILFFGFLFAALILISLISASECATSGVKINPRVYIPWMVALFLSFATFVTTSYVHFCVLEPDKKMAIEEVRKQYNWRYDRCQEYVPQHHKQCLVDAWPIKYMKDKYIARDKRIGHDN